MQELPLAGITVLEFSQYLAGPYCGLRLADLGARVIKVERPSGGDACRQLAVKNLFADGDSLVFHAVNRNKESYAANLKDPNELEKVRQLIAEADVMTHNFRPGVMEKIGLDFASVQKIKPDIIYGQVTGYSSEGPWKNKPGQDLLAQSVSGLTWLTGRANSSPLPMGLAVGDMLCGTHLAQGILAALLRRQSLSPNVSQGALVEVSLLESLLDFQFEVLTSYYNDGGKLPQRSSSDGAHAYLGAPYGIYKTSDGHIALAMGSLPDLSRLLGCALPESQGQQEQPIENEQEAQFSPREQVNQIIASRLQQKNTKEWLRILDGQYWCSAVYNYEELFSHPACEVLKMAQTVQRQSKTGTEVTLQTLRCPIRLNGAKLFNTTAAPILGSGNDKIETWLSTRQSAKVAKNPSNISESKGKQKKEAPLPLTGVTVLDFSQFLSGPSASLRLADLGATVIKVELPEKGDLCRRLYLSSYRLDNDSMFFHAVNRNKRSIELDLRTEQETVEKLLAQSDVMIHNFRPGVIESWGYSYEEVKQRHPHLIYAAISGYGEEGPWYSKPGQDLLVQSLSGLTWLSGNNADGPVAMGLAIVDMLAGAQLAQGILAALVRQMGEAQQAAGSARTSLKKGTGSLVQTSLLEAALDLQIEPLTFRFYEGGGEAQRSQSNNAHAYLGAPYGIYATRNGYLALAMANIVQLGELLDCRGLLTYTLPKQWFHQRDQIKQILADHLVSQDTQDWLQILEPADIWCAEVLNWEQLRRQETYQILQIEQNVKRGNGTNYVTTRCPIRLDGQRIYHSQGSPTLGEHQDEIMAELLKPKGKR